MNEKDKMTVPMLESHGLLAAARCFRGLLFPGVRRQGPWGREHDYGQHNLLAALQRWLFREAFVSS